MESYLWRLLLVVMLEENDLEAVLPRRVTLAKALEAKGASGNEVSTEIEVLLVSAFDLLVESALSVMLGTSLGRAAESACLLVKEMPLLHQETASVAVSEIAFHQEKQIWLLARTENEPAGQRSFLLATPNDVCCYADLKFPDQLAFQLHPSVEPCRLRLGFYR